MRRGAVAEKLGEKGITSLQRGNRDTPAERAGRGPLGKVTDTLSNKGGTPGAGVSLPSPGSGKQDHAGAGEQFGLSGSTSNPARDSSDLDRDGFSADSRKGWTGVDSMDDHMSTEGSRVDRSEVYVEDDGSITFIESHYDSETGQTTQSVIRIGSDGSVQESGSVDGKEVYSSGGTGQGNSSDQGNTNTASGEEDKKPQSGKDDDSSTPNPLDDGGGKGKTWSQMNATERANVRKAGESKKQSFMNPGSDGSGVSSASDLQKTDPREAMGQRLSPYVNPGEDGGGESIPGAPTSGSVTPGSAPGTLGGDTVDPLGSGDPSGGSGNPLDPDNDRGGSPSGR